MRTVIDANVMRKRRVTSQKAGWVLVRPWAFLTPHTLPIVLRSQAEWATGGHPRQEK